jgi:hypothetical protein
MPCNRKKQADSLLVLVLLGVLFGALWAAGVEGLWLAFAAVWSGSLDEFLKHPPPPRTYFMFATAPVASSLAAWVGSLAGVLGCRGRFPPNRWRSVLLPSVTGAGLSAVMGAVAGLVFGWATDSVNWGLGLALVAGLEAGIACGWWGTRALLGGAKDTAGWNALADPSATQGTLD